MNSRVSSDLSVLQTSQLLSLRVWFIILRLRPCSCSYCLFYYLNYVVWLQMRRNLLFSAAVIPRVCTCEQLLVAWCIVREVGLKNCRWKQGFLLILDFTSKYHKTSSNALIFIYLRIRTTLGISQLTSLPCCNTKAITILEAEHVTAAYFNGDSCLRRIFHEVQLSQPLKLAG